MSSPITIQVTVYDQESSPYYRVLYEEAGVRVSDIVSRFTEKKSSSDVLVLGDTLRPLSPVNAYLGGKERVDLFRDHIASRCRSGEWIARTITAVVGLDNTKGADEKKIILMRRCGIAKIDPDTTRLFSDEHLAIYIDNKPPSSAYEVFSSKSSTFAPPPDTLVTFPVDIVGRSDVKRLVLRKPFDVSVKAFTSGLHILLMAAAPTLPTSADREETDDDESDAARKENDSTLSRLPKELARKMLRRENELRMSEEAQRRFDEAEKRQDMDWIFIAHDLQRQVLREFDFDPNSSKDLHRLRMAALEHPDIPIHQVYNRAREGFLRVGDVIPSSLSLAPLRDTGESARRSLVGLITPRVPLVVMAGSYS